MLSVVGGLEAHTSGKESWQKQPETGVVQGSGKAKQVIKETSLTRSKEDEEHRLQAPREPGKQEATTT